MSRTPWVYLATAVWLVAAATGLSALWKYDNAPGKRRDCPGALAGRQRARPHGRSADAGSARASAMLLHAREPRRAGRSARARPHARRRPTCSSSSPRVSPTTGCSPTSGRRPRRFPASRSSATTTAARRARFGSATSGQTLLYDGDGALRFSGGITGSRSHAGDNAGRRSLVALLNGAQPDRDGDERVRLPAVCVRHLISMITPTPCRPSGRRASELFAAYQRDIYKSHRPAVRRPDGLPVDRRHRVRAVGVAAGLVRLRQPHAHPRLGGRRRRRDHQPVPGAPRPASPGPALDALHDRRRADADGRAAHPPHRRTPRNPLSRLRLARLSRVLSRLARPGSGHHRRRARPHAARRCSGRSRSTASWSPASGAGWNTRPG